MTSFGKTITLFLMDGDPNRRWVCELSNWNGKAYKIPRVELKKCAARPELSGCGVYFLFGRNDSDDRGAVYIGEAENVFERLKQHDGPTGKDFWNECIVFVSKDNRLNKAHVKYLEHCCYQQAKKADRYVIENSSVPTRSSLTEAEQAEMDEFLYNIRMLINALGHKALEPLVDTALGTSEESEHPILHIHAARGADARGMQTSEGFVVFAGSQIADSTTRSCPKGICTLRDRLLAGGVIDQEWILTEDRVFSSPSAAAAIVMGRSANGLTEWRQQE